MSNFREGDIVTLEARLDYVHPDDKQLRAYVLGTAGPTYVARNNMSLAKPVIMPNDTVRLKGRPMDDPEGVVLAVAEDHAWVAFGPGEFGSWHLPLVERVRLAGEKPKGGDA